MVQLGEHTQTKTQTQVGDCLVFIEWWLEIATYLPAHLQHMIF